MLYSLERNFNFQCCSTSVDFSSAKPNICDTASLIINTLVQSKLSIILFFHCHEIIKLTAFCHHVLTMLCLLERNFKLQCRSTPVSFPHINQTATANVLVSNCHTEPIKLSIIFLPNRRSTYAKRILQSYRKGRLCVSEQNVKFQCNQTSLDGFSNQLSIYNEHLR